MHIRYSVVIPAYNSKRHIIDTVCSVMKQTLQPHEVIIVDDGSIDGTPDLVRREYPAVRLIQQNRTGSCGSRNTGAMAATGDVVAFLDHDDLWCPWTLERYEDLFQRYPDALAVGGTTKVFEDGNLPTVERLEDPIVWHYDAVRVCLECGFALTSALAVRKDAFIASGMFKIGAIEQGGSEEWDLCFRLGKLGDLVSCSEIVALYRLHATNTAKSGQYNAQVKYRCTQDNITKYWKERCREIDGHRPGLEMAVMANRYIIQHFDKCEETRYWSALRLLLLSVMVWPHRLDSFHYSEAFLRARRIIVIVKLMAKKLLFGA